MFNKILFINNKKPHIAVPKERPFFSQPKRSMDTGDQNYWEIQFCFYGSSRTTLLIGLLSLVDSESVREN